MPEATFQDLQMAINGFNSSLKDYAVNQAVNNATAQVQQLNAAGLDEAQRRQQADLLSRDLALQLTSIGATGQQVQSAFSAIAPQQVNNYGELYGQGLATGSEELKSQAKDWKKFMNEDKLRLQETALAQKSLTMQQKQHLALNTDFNKRVAKAQDMHSNWNVKLDEMDSKIRLIEDGLAKNDNAIIINAASTVIPKALGEVGALTEADKAPYEGSRALASQVIRKLERAKSGKIDEESRKLLLGLVSKLRDLRETQRTRNAQMLAKKLKVYANEQSGLNLSDEEALRKVTGDELGLTTPASPTSAPQPQQGWEDLIIRRTK